MIKTPAQCPICRKFIHITRLKCPNCRITMEGNFTFSRLARLSEEDQHFIEVFINKRGNIKEVEKILNISYPTVCKRLSHINKALERE